MTGPDRCSYLNAGNVAGVLVLGFIVLAALFLLGLVAYRAVAG